MRILCSLLLALALVPAASMAQATYAMPWSVAGSGGGRSTGGVYALDGVAGQTGGLQSGSGVYALFSGFPVPVLPGIPTDVGSTDPVPRAFHFSAPQPSPFRDRVAIAFELPDSRHVSVLVHSVDGRLVAKLVDADFGAGRHRVLWNGNDAAGRAVHSGMYFVHVTAGSESATQRLVRLQ